MDTEMCIKYKYLLISGGYGVAMFFSVLMFLTCTSNQNTSWVLKRGPVLKYAPASNFEKKSSLLCQTRTETKDHEMILTFTIIWFRTDLTMFLFLSFLTPKPILISLIVSEILMKYLLKIQNGRLEVILFFVINNNLS